MQVSNLKDGQLNYWLMASQDPRRSANEFAADWPRYKEIWESGRCQPIDWNKIGPLLDQYDIELVTDPYPRHRSRKKIAKWVRRDGSVGSQYGPDYITAAARAIVERSFGEVLPTPSAARRMRGRSSSPYARM